MTSGLQLGLIPQLESRELALIFGAFVFPPMLLCAVLSFFGRETLGATPLGLISFSWLASALVEFVAAPDPTSSALGVLYLALAVVLLCLGVIGLLGKPLLSVVIRLAFSRYGLNGLYEFTASGGLLDHRPVTTLALPELFFRLLTFGEVDHRGHLVLAPVVGDDRCLSSVGKMMPSFRRPCAS